MTLESLYFDTSPRELYVKLKKNTHTQLTLLKNKTKA